GQNPSLSTGRASMTVISSSSTLAPVIDTPNSAVRQITSATGQQVDSMSKGLGSHRWFGHLDDGPRPAQHCDHTPNTTHPRSGRADKRAAYDVLASQRDLDLSAELANITIPSGVIIGRHDPTRTVAQAREFADHFVNATFTVLETGHTPVFEAPEQVADCIRGLLSEQ